MESRLRGNDINCTLAVIPAKPVLVKAGSGNPCGLSEHECGRKGAGDISGVNTGGEAAFHRNVDGLPRIASKESGSIRRRPGSDEHSGQIG